MYQNADFGFDKMLDEIIEENPDNKALQQFKTVNQEPHSISTLTATVEKNNPYKAATMLSLQEIEELEDFFAADGDMYMKILNIKSLKDTHNL